MSCVLRCFNRLSRTYYYYFLFQTKRSELLNVPFILHKVKTRTKASQHGAFIFANHRFLQDFNVIDSAAAKLQALLEAGPGEELLILYLGGAAGLMAVLLVIVISVCLHQRSKFQRQLKAATATAFGESKMLSPLINFYVSYVEKLFFFFQRSMYILQNVRSILLLPMCVCGALILRLIQNSSYIVGRGDWKMCSQW